MPALYFYFPEFGKFVTIVPFQLSVVERVSIEWRKTKTKVITFVQTAQ